MPDEKEIQPTGIERQLPEQDWRVKYRNLIYNEATSLLAQYLPEALPSEPTVTAFLYDEARYWGKFRGRHFITLTSYATEVDERWSAKGENFDDPGVEPDWRKYTGSLNTRSGYSKYTWDAIQTGIHELTHQKQQELDPFLYPDLSSPELNQVDLNQCSPQHLWNLIVAAWDIQVKPRDQKISNSIYFPVIEGMAKIVSLYVMKRLTEDLIKAGEIESVEKVKRVRHWEILRLLRKHEELRKGLAKPTDYSALYLEGERLMRVLYKKFGTDTPKLLTKIDFRACQQIMRNSPEYQQISENPLLLPGLLQAA